MMGEDVAKPAEDGSGWLPFIVSTDSRKADPETRKLIRSRVMLGKNRVKPRRKLQSSSQEIKQEASVSVAINGLSRISRLLCSELSLIPFAENVAPSLIADIFSFSSMFSKAMFVLDRCIVSQRAAMPQAWFEPLLSDAGYLYAACFTVQTYFDGFLGRTRSIEAQRLDRWYYAKAIRLLQERLTADDDTVRLSDSTILTVLALSGHAYTTGDYESAYYHCNGLLKLVSMRGVRTFLQNTKLMIEIIRCDLSMAVDRVVNPLLAEDNGTFWPLTPISNHAGAANAAFSLSQLHYGVDVFLSKLNSDLVELWFAMHNFCTLANAAAVVGGTKITEETFLHGMSSIMYGLLHHHFDPGSLDEAVRLGLLAFACPIFLHWNRVELHDRRFTSVYRRALAGLDTTEDDLVPSAHLWLLTVGALSMAHEPEGLDWFRTRLSLNIELCNIFTWDDMRDLLDSFLWIGLVYDEPCREVFESIHMQ